MHSLEIKEHYELARADHTEQLIDILSVFHRYCRNLKLVTTLHRMHDSQEKSSLVKQNTYLGAYERLFDKYPEIKDNILYDIGFGLQTKKSGLEHPGVNTGVFLRLLNRQSVPAGTLLGFVPGFFDKAPKTRQLTFKQEEMFRHDNIVFKVDDKIPYPYQMNPSKEIEELIENGE